MTHKKSLDMVVREAIQPIKDDLTNIVMEGILNEIYNIVVKSLFDNFKKVGVDPEAFEFTIGQKDQLFDHLKADFMALVNPEEQAVCAPECQCEKTDEVQE